MLFGTQNFSIKTQSAILQTSNGSKTGSCHNIILFLQMLIRIFIVLKMCLFPHFVRSHLKFTLRTNKTFVSNHSNNQAQQIQTILIIDLGFSHMRSAARELHNDHKKVLQILSYSSPMILIAFPELYYYHIYQNSLYHISVHKTQTQEIYCLNLDVRTKKLHYVCLIYRRTI